LRRTSKIDTMKFPKILICCLISIGIFILSCSSDGGEQGPQGDAGANCWEAPGISDINNDGIINILDCVGNDGEAGLDGNANVNKMEFDLTETSPGLSVIIIDVPELTENLLENNTLLFHLEFYDPEKQRYYALPGYHLGYTLYFQPVYEAGWIALVISTSDGNNGGWPQFIEGYGAILHVTMVEISDTQSHLGSKDLLEKLKLDGVDPNNLEEIMEYYKMD